MKIGIFQTEMNIHDILKKHTSHFYQNGYCGKLFLSKNARWPYIHFLIPIYCIFNIFGIVESANKIR